MARTMLSGESQIKKLSWKQRVRAATTADMAFDSGTEKTVPFDTFTIDGVDCVLYDRVLLKNQVTSSENGIYQIVSVVPISDEFTITFARTADADDDAIMDVGAGVWVQEGTANGAKLFVQSAADTWTRYPAAEHTWVIGEVPSGDIDNDNVEFVLDHTPLNGIILYLNGQRMTEGIDYTLSVATITMTEAPHVDGLVADVLVADYQY